MADKNECPVNPAVYAMRMLQAEMKDEAELAGIRSEEAIMEIVKAARAENCHELDAKLQHSYAQSVSGEGRLMGDVFDELERDLK